MKQNSRAEVNSKTTSLPLV